MTTLLWRKGETFFSRSTKHCFPSASVLKTCGEEEGGEGGEREEEF